MEQSINVANELLKNRIIYFGTQVDENSASWAITSLLYLDSINHDDIYMYINSPGGVVTDLYGIYDTMQCIKSDVSTVCVGLAASAAAVILLSGTKGKRYALPNSEIMIHQPSGGTQGQATDIEIAAKHIVNMRKRLNNIIVTHTGQNINKVTRDVERDNYMTAEEALEYGIVDKIIRSTGDING